MVIVGVVSSPMSPPVEGIEGGVANVANALAGADMIILLSLAMV